MRSRTFAPLVLPLLLAGVAPASGRGLPAGRGALLPLQDRVGDAGLAELIETALRRGLEEHASLALATEVRSVQRSLRIRDASDEPPERLEILADRLAVDWFFLATLHEARVGRELRRQDATALGGDRIEDSGDTPQVVLSARIFRRSSPAVWWSGFHGATGRDGEGVFGLGTVESLEELTEGAVDDLLAQALTGEEGRRKVRLRRRQEGFLRVSDVPSPPATVAVIPMDSVAELDSSASAEVVTAALFAALHEAGFTALLPGHVRVIRQDSGQGRPGAASRAEWEALARDAGAAWVATGTVEGYRRGYGRAPDPWIAFSVRFLDPASGAIAWLDGLDRSGRDTASAFERGRIYSSGDLTYTMMRSLFGRLQASSAAGRRARGD